MSELDADAAGAGDEADDAGLLNEASGEGMSEICQEEEVKSELIIYTLLTGEVPEASKIPEYYQGYSSG